MRNFKFAKIKGRICKLEHTIEEAAQRDEEMKDVDEK